MPSSAKPSEISRKLRLIFTELRSGLRRQHGGALTQKQRKNLGQRECLKDILTYLENHRAEPALQGNKEDGTEFPHDYKVEYFIDDFLMRCIRKVDEENDPKENHRLVMDDAIQTADVMTEFGTAAEPAANNHQDTAVEDCLRDLVTGKSASFEAFFVANRGRFEALNSELRDENERKKIESADHLRDATVRYLLRGINRAIGYLKTQQFRDSTEPITDTTKEVLYCIFTRNYSLWQWCRLGKIHSTKFADFVAQDIRDSHGVSFRDRVAHDERDRKSLESVDWESVLIQ